MAQSNLHNAKQAKKDEFYTQYPDIERECERYREQFRGKVVYCNCDDPAESNFFKYFADNFDFFGLKKLTTTHYDANKKSYKLELYKDINSDGLIDGKDIVKTELVGDGDFRNKECIILLKEADVVVTNPPFSLFREYVAQLVEYDKKFLIIGHQNAITYKEIFKLIKDNKMWLGYGFKGGAAYFINRHYEDYAVAGTHKEGMIRVSGVNWFTNLDVSKRHDDLTLYETYSPEKYPKYDNYDAINVDKTAEIPADYDAVMGVPITFLDKYNPEQFEILGITDRANTSGLRTKKYTAQEVPNFNDLNARSVIRTGSSYKAVYARLLIRNKKVKE